MAPGSTPPRSSAPHTRVLLVVDNSGSSQRAIRYCSNILSSWGKLNLSLAYVLPPLPADLLEFGGAEDPEKEDQLQAGLHQQQQQWFAEARRQAQPLLHETKRNLAVEGAATEFEIEYIEPDTGRETAGALLAAARQRGCSTIVVGHRSHSWFEGLGGHDLVEELLRHAEGFAIWVVE